MVRLGDESRQLEACTYHMFMGVHAEDWAGAMRKGVQVKIGCESLPPWTAESKHETP